MVAVSATTGRAMLRDSSQASISDRPTAPPPPTIIHTSVACWAWAWARERASRLRRSAPSKAVAASRIWPMRLSPRPPLIRARAWSRVSGLAANRICGSATSLRQAWAAASNLATPSNCSVESGKLRSRASFWSKNAPARS